MQVVEEEDILIQVHKLVEVLVDKVAVAQVLHQVRQQEHLEHMLLVVEEVVEELMEATVVLVS
jgi:hypothetical protein